MRTFTGMTVAGALPRLCVAILIATAGCKSKALQELDGSGGGIGGIDAGGTGVGDGRMADAGGFTDGGGAVDRPALDVPFAGRRSFVVTAEVYAAGGTTSVTSHVFTMALDPGQRTAVLGVPGGGQFRPVEETTAGFRIVGSLGFGVPVSAPCGGSLQYDDFDFAVDASGGGMSGKGRGVLTTYDGADVLGQQVPATMVLRGVPDAAAPTLTLTASGDLADPWTPLWVVASEPLPERQMQPVLRSASGDVIAFDSQDTPDPFVAVFAKPTRMLRFGEEYRVTFEGITDLAGNAPLPSAPPMFTTRAPPTLIPGDGFESVTDATLGGAQVLSGDGAPVIAGARSLYIPPAISLGPSGRQTQFLVRLSVASGQRVVRFESRTVNPSDAAVSWIVAGIGGEIETATPAFEAGDPTAPATIDGTQVSLGPTKTAEILLRPDARGEVVVARIATQGGRCGGPPPPPVPGAIIDNLRVE
jgi:hypothetical protein